LFWLVERVSVHSTRQSHSRSKGGNGSRSDPADPYPFLFSRPTFATEGPWRGVAWHPDLTTHHAGAMFHVPEPVTCVGARRNRETPYFAAENPGDGVRAAWAQTSMCLHQSSFVLSLLLTPFSALTTMVVLTAVLSEGNSDG
jgi:hypothetical protein